jgi:protein-disulfide isomerase
MRKIWLVLAALFLAPAIAVAADTPTVAPSDHVLGKADAPITIFEYASLTCPHCAAFDQETLPKIKESWIDTGKAKLVFRDFPLDGEALRAAMVARCAPPERYFGFIDALFRTQESWALSKDLNAALGRIAKLGGMSQEKVDACLKNDKLADEIVAERAVAEKQYGIDSTPTFFINGTKLVGDQPYSEFEKALKAASKS